MAAAAGGTGLFVLIVFVPALRDAALRYTAALLLTVFGTGLVCDVLALTIRSRRVRRVLGSIRVALPDLMSLFCRSGRRTCCRALRWARFRSGDGGV